MLKLKRTLCGEWFYHHFPDLTRVEMSADAFRNAVVRTSNLGYDALELVPAVLGPNAIAVPTSVRAQHRQILAENGLEFAGLHWSMMGASIPVHLTDPQKIDNNATWLAGVGNLCADLGGKIVVVGSPKQRNIAAVPNLSYADGKAAFAESFRTAASRVPAGVTFALEQLASYETDFLTDFDEAAELVNLIGMPNVRLVWDYKALLLMDKTPLQAAELFRKHRAKIVHVHLNDKDLGGPKPDGTDIGPVMQAIKDTGFDGFVSVEVFKGEGFENTARIALAEIDRQWQLVCN